MVDSTRVHVSYHVNSLCLTRATNLSDFRSFTLLEEDLFRKRAHSVISRSHLDLAALIIIAIVNNVLQSHSNIE
jgi:hypothetical protein